VVGALTLTLATIRCGGDAAEPLTRSIRLFANCARRLMHSNHCAKALKAINDPLQFVQRSFDGAFVFLHRTGIQERKFEHSLEYGKRLRRLV
jgi:hypothetical protein